MAEALAGTIDQMSLLEILKLLNSGKMSGCLKITNSYGLGELYVKAGQIIHCVTGSNIGEAALATMLGWIEGKFSFEMDVSAPEQSIESSTEQLLLESARKIEDWQDIKKVISSTDIVFALSTKSATGAINLEPEEWQILSHVNGNRTVAEIIEQTGKDEYHVAKVLFHLVSIGLLEKTEKTASPLSATIDEKFFERVEKELTNVIGPIASIVIDEAVEDLGESRSAFPNTKIAALIEKVGVDIKDEDKKLQFSQIMLEALKSF